MNKHKKLGIAALVLDAIAALFLIFAFLKLSMTVLVIPIILIAGIIISIISLKGMKKHHSKGLWIPISAIVISAILLIPALYMAYFLGSLFMAFRPTTVYTYEVPMTVTIDTYNLDFSMLPTADKRDIIIFTHPKGDDFPEICTPEFFQFNSLQSLIYFEKDSRYSITSPEDYRNPYRGSISTFPMDMIRDDASGGQGITFHLGETASRTYMIELSEKYNNPGETKKLLESGNDEFYIRYYYNPAMLDPRKEYAINTTGCYPFPRAAKEGILEIKGTSGTEKRHESQIVCLKQFHSYDSYLGKYELDDCTFYEMSYDINIQYDIGLSKGETKATVVYPHI